VPEESRDWLVRAIRYRQVDVSDPDSVGDAVRDAVCGGKGAPVAVYLALPPGLFAPTIRTLCLGGLPPGSRVAVEKPFGEDLDSAVELNGLLARLCDSDGECGPFRVDHFLGLASVQNLLGMRLANRVLGPVWNSAHVEQVDVVWEESLGLEGRAAYYDSAGQLKDMIQNHLLQVLCLLTMEPPEVIRYPELRDCKIALLRAVRPPRRDEMAALTRRARYTAGRIGDRDLPAYLDEPGVDPARDTETFAELTLAIDNERWSGTRFVVRTAKALGRPRMQVVARFRPVADRTGTSSGSVPRANELRIGLDEPGTITLQLNGAAAGSPLDLAPVTLSGHPPPSALPPYSRVLLDLLNGDSTLSVGAEEAEEAWRIVSPVLQAWADDLVPMLEYPAGSTGPAG
jgi:glucose-6-phosphate 1-dehydrogenase